MRQLLALLLALLSPALACAQTAPQPRPLAFTHVTLIDTTGGSPATDSTVVLVGDRIVAVGRTGRVRIPAGAQVVDAAGKFLMPGLWDMHFTATLNPARYLGLSGTLGTVEQGKLADLVLLDANPLEKIGNTRKTAAVVAGGRYLPKESLQRMLADVEARANKN